MPDISEFLSIGTTPPAQVKKEQRVGIDISEFLGEESAKPLAGLLPTFRKPALPELTEQAITGIGKGISGLFKPSEKKPVDVTKPYYPEPVSTYTPGTIAPRPATLKAGVPIVEQMAERVPQLKAGKEPSETPVDDLLDRYRQFVGTLPEGRKGVEWILAKGSQFVYGVPIAIHDLLSLPGEVIAGRKTPAEANQILYESFPKPVNDFLNVASYAVSPLGTGETEEQRKVSVRESWKNVKANPEAAFFSVGMGLGGLTSLISFIGKMRGFVIAPKNFKMIENTIKEESPTIPDKPVSRKIPPEIQEEPSIGKLAIEQGELLQRIMDKAKLREVPSETQAKGKEILAKGGKPSWRDWFALQANSRNVEDFVKWGESHKHFTDPEVINQLKESGIEFKTPQELYAKLKGEPIVGIGERKVRGLSKHIEEKAIEEGLTKGFGDLPEYDVLKMKEQARITAGVVNKDYETGRRIAMGLEASPEGTTPEAFLVAIEATAKRVGDVGTIRDLALVSKLPEQATTMGQRIRTLAERDPESLVGHIRDIAQKRMETVKVRVRNVEQVRQRLVEGIKTEIRKTAPSRQTWEQFINSIRC